MRPFADVLAVIGIVLAAFALVGESVATELETTYALSPAAHMLPAGTAVASIELSDGSTVEIALYERTTPRTAYHFIELAKRGFYDGTTWNRVVPGFVVQGGAAGVAGFLGEVQTPEPESNDVPCSRGAVFMARNVIPEEIEGYRYAETLGDQFCILLEDAFYLNDDFTVFGGVISGMGFLDDVEEDEPIVSVKVIYVRHDR
jgi:cyclophilin family peptidyl-prolyl cis-trans isomerase